MTPLPAVTHIAPISSVPASLHQVKSVPCHVSRTPGPTTLANYTEKQCAKQWMRPEAQRDKHGRGHGKELGYSCAHAMLCDASVLLLLVACESTTFISRT